MNEKKARPRAGQRWRAVVARGLLAFCIPTNPATAEVESELEKLVVSALRVPRDAADITSAVTVLDPAELQSRGLRQLREALNESPGVIATSTGGETGALGSLFIRGTTTNYSQMVVDGMRLSDSTTPLGNILGASRVFDLGRIEILRGAQGAAYGGESVGGVLWMETARGQGDPRVGVFAEAGSFGSYSTALKYQGETKGLSYFVSGAYEETENDAPSQDFNQSSTALRVEQATGRDWLVGLTFRGLTSDYNNRGLSQDGYDATLTTVYAKGRIKKEWRTTFLAGFQQEFYDSDSSFGHYGTDLRAISLSNDHDIEFSDTLHFLCGVFAHRSDFSNSIGTAADRDRYGAHAALEWKPLPGWQTYAAARFEHYDAYGEETTWRVGSSYQLKNSATIVRAGVGSSFRAPSYLDLYGSSFGAGNPDLNAESALGWDVGIEQKIGSALWFQATLFRNEIRDNIDSFAQPMPVNREGTTATQGLETAVKGRLLRDDLTYRLAWTYLSESLSEQPKSHLQASLDWQAGEKLMIGIGLRSLTDHSWGGDDLEGYTLWRVYTQYRVSEHLQLHARLENLTNENYLLSDFYGDPIAGAGFGVFGGLSIEW